MDDLSINLTDPDNAATLEQLEARIVALMAYRTTLTEHSPEANQVASELAKLRLQKKLLGPIIADEPLEGGTQTGKRILTLADGSRWIFKLASGEGSDKKRKTE